MARFGAPSGQSAEARVYREAAALRAPYGVSVETIKLPAEEGNELDQEGNDLDGKKKQLDEEQNDLDEPKKHLDEEEKQLDDARRARRPRFVRVSLSRHLAR